MLAQTMWHFMCAKQLAYSPLAITRVTVARTLKPYEKEVLLDSTSGAYTVTLPKVAEAVGSTYTFLRTVGANTVTLAGGGDVTFTNIPLAGVGTKATLMCDASGWHVLE